MMDARDLLVQSFPSELAKVVDGCRRPFRCVEDVSQVSFYSSIRESCRLLSTYFAFTTQAPDGCYDRIATVLTLIEADVPGSTQIE
jgi:hypothetical protein